MTRLFLICFSRRPTPNVQRALRQFVGDIFLLAVVVSTRTTAVRLVLVFFLFVLVCPPGWIFRALNFDVYDTSVNYSTIVGHCLCLHFANCIAEINTLSKFVLLCSANYSIILDHCLCLQIALLS